MNKTEALFLSLNSLAATWPRLFYTSTSYYHVHTKIYSVVAGNVVEVSAANIVYRNKRSPSLDRDYS